MAGSFSQQNRRRVALRVTTDSAGPPRHANFHLCDLGLTRRAARAKAADAIPFPTRSSRFENIAGAGRGYVTLVEAT
jgi:hypothetical protein